MHDLDSVRTWEEFGRTLSSELEASGVSLAHLWRGVVYRSGPVAQPALMSHSTYYRVLRGQSRPARPALQALLFNAKRSPVEIEQWLDCWERLIREHAATKHIMTAATEQTQETSSGSNESPPSSALGTAGQLMSMILRRRSKLRKMRTNLGPNHPYTVPFEFETNCYADALINPRLVRARLLDRIGQSVHAGHGLPRRFGTHEELLGRVDEYLMILSVVEDELERSEASPATDSHDPFVTDFAELRVRRG